MQLQPTEPPGNSQRKLRGFAAEISRLRAEGYTIRAIRQALAGVGVEVGWSTVQREVARIGRPSAAVAPIARSTTTRPERPPQVTAVSSPAMPSSPAAAADAQDVPITARRARTKGDVDEFFKKFNTNPLFKTKGPPS